MYTIVCNSGFMTNYHEHMFKREQAATPTDRCEARGDGAIVNGDYEAAEISYTDAIEMHQKEYGIGKTDQLRELYSKLAHALDAQGKDAKTVRRISEIMAMVPDEGDDNNVAPAGG